jgi:cell division protein ZapB
MSQVDAIAELRAIRLDVERMVALVQRLGEENRALRQANEQMAGERSALLAKSEQARSRVEAMIARLKSLEQNG